MKRKFKTKSGNPVARILCGNSGASIILVAIIAILVITAVIVLRIATSALWASADKQLNQDQAYELATSMGNSLDVLIIKEKKLNLVDAAKTNGGVIYTQDSISGLPGSKLKVTVAEDADKNYIVTVESHVAQAEYLYEAKYNGAGTYYVRIY